MTLELTPEDSLRLNVMLANAEAIRINENTMEVFGLQGEQEMRATLHPTGNPDRYLKQVRELLASSALDSPEGYPVYIRRWTRTGQLDSDRLESLLKLGNPEAVMAVVCSPGLTNDLAKRAWWCEPHAEYARKMLTNPAVVAGSMGPVLAQHLVEHLPFETEHQAMLETVQLVLQKGLIETELKQKLWNRGRTNKSYRVGFLLSAPDDIPEPADPHPLLNTHGEKLRVLANQGNPCAALLLRVFDASGQRFILSLIDSLRRPADQDIASALFNAIGTYFASARIDLEPIREWRKIDQLLEQSQADKESALGSIMRELPELKPQVTAATLLAHVDETLLIPVLSVTDAVGSVMRKRIAPLTEKIQAQLDILRPL